MVKYTLCPEGEEPLDNIVMDGGFCSIFKSIVCIGDSLLSGAFEYDYNGGHFVIDITQYSWGLNIARATGAKVNVFSRGGMTADEYINTFADSKGYWAKELAAQAYIIALGVNDVLNAPEYPMGSIDDIKENYKDNEKTFAGYYGAIIQRYKEIQPDAKFFLVTIPSDVSYSEQRNNRAEEHAEVLRSMPKKFSNTYVVDLRKYTPVLDAEYLESFTLFSHFNPMGYMMVGRQIMSYIDYIIRHNMKDFKQVGFIGLPYGNLK